MTEIEKLLPERMIILENVIGIICQDPALVTLWRRKLIDERFDDLTLVRRRTAKAIKEEENELHNK